MKIKILCKKLRITKRSSRKIFSGFCLVNPNLTKWRNFLSYYFYMLKNVYKNSLWWMFTQRRLQETRWPKLISHPAVQVCSIYDERSTQQIDCFFLWSVIHKFITNVRESWMVSSEIYSDILERLLLGCSQHSWDSYKLFVGPLFNSLFCPKALSLHLSKFAAGLSWWSW